MSISLKMKSSDHALIYGFDHINELTEFPVVHKLNVKKVEIDLLGLQTMNSVGIRDWIEWVSQFPEDCRFSFANCPRVFIDIVAMILGVFPKNAEIESIEVPYYCEKCDDTTTIIKTLKASEIVNSRQCIVCQSHAELDYSQKTVKQIQDKMVDKTTSQID